MSVTWREQIKEYREVLREILPVSHEKVETIIEFIEKRAIYQTKEQNGRVIANAAIVNTTYIESDEAPTIVKLIEENGVVVFDEKSPHYFCRGEIFVVDEEELIPGFYIKFKNFLSFGTVVDITCKVHCKPTESEE